MNTAQNQQAWLQALEQPQYHFADTLAFIEQNYRFVPTAFRNGDVTNSADQNQGSCRILALATMLELTDQQTLLCFGEFYRDVLATPEGTDHQNIRQLMKSGLANVDFEQIPLTLR